MRLSLREREEIFRGLATGESRRSIATGWSAPSTIVREAPATVTASLSGVHG